MFEKIKLAQSEVIQNLSESEDKLLELDRQLNAELDAYEQAANVSSQSTFFNLDNPYLWIVLIGLLLFAFGLIFLLAELHHNTPPKEKKEKKKVKVEKKLEPEKKKVETGHRSDSPEKKSGKAVKIKVVKVK